MTVRARGWLETLAASPQGHPGPGYGLLGDQASRPHAVDVAVRIGATGNHGVVAHILSSRTILVGFRRLPAETRVRPIASPRPLAPARRGPAAPKRWTRRAPRRPRNTHRASPRRLHGGVQPRPDEWLATFADPTRAQSAIDRLTGNAYDLLVDGESYRLRQKPARRAESTSEPEPLPAMSPSKRRRTAA